MGDLGLPGRRAPGARVKPTMLGAEWGRMDYGVLKLCISKMGFIMGKNCSYGVHHKIVHMNHNGILQNGVHNGLKYF